MDTKFPQMLYRFPGTEPIHGANFATLVVADADELEAALDSGWAETTTAALDLHAEAKAKEQAVVTTATPPASAPAPAPRAGGRPTRDELEAEATKLGIAFDHQVSNKKLTELIAAKSDSNA